MTICGCLITTVMIAAAAASAPPSVAQGPERVPVGTTTVVGTADSVFGRLLTVLEAEGCVLGRVDRARRAVVAACSGSDAEEITFRVQPKADSATVSAQGVRGGIAAMIVGLSIVRKVVRAPMESGARRMASGADWRQDGAGRVGLLILSEEGRRFARRQKSDTVFELRPQELPASLRESWEEHINDVGFDASCARVFRTDDLFLLRWNRCSAPDPEYDRLSLYGADGAWRGSAVGPSIAHMVTIMCPVRRPTVAAASDQRCPPPFE
jgi:hypothetical protein